MGANFHYYIYREVESDLDEFHSEYQHCLEEGSDSYRGHLGVLPSGLRFAEIEPFAEASEVIEYLEDNHYKWDCALAVPFHGELRQHDFKSKITQRKKTKQGLVQLEEKFLKQIKSTKSKTIACKSCGSSVSRS